MRFAYSGPTPVRGLPLPSPWIPASAGVSVLSVKDSQVTGTGDCRIRRMLSTQAGYEPRFRTKNGAGDRVDELAGQ